MMFQNGMAGNKVVVVVLDNSGMVAAGENIVAEMNVLVFVSVPYGVEAVGVKQAEGVVEVLVVGEAVAVAGVATGKLFAAVLQIEIVKIS